LKSSRSNPGERIIGPVADELLGLIARIDRLTEQVSGLLLSYDLKRAVGEVEERTRLYLGLPLDPEGEHPFAFRRAEDGTLVLVSVEPS